METYLYFAENLGGDAAGDCAVYPASTFTGIDPISATTTRISFKALAGTAADDDILLTHVTGKFKEVAELIASVLAPSPVTRTKFIVVADEANSVYLDNGNGAGLTGTVEVTTIA